MQLDFAEGKVAVMGQLQVKILCRIHLREVVLVVVEVKWFCRLYLEIHPNTHHLIVWQ